VSLEEFRKKFCIPELVILTTTYWTWSVRTGHCTLGAGVLSLNRLCKTFAELTPEETKELSVVFPTIERTLSRSFSNEKINYLALMMIDEHVHYHVIPRYSIAKEFAGKLWTDPQWKTGLPDTKNHGEVTASSPVLQEILLHLKKNLAP
jgi:diadenosine tetraphosphate (Ap4A) HIT family hydrolase